MNRPSWLDLARESWKHRGESRPPFALPTGPGQESVWDYPRPPQLVADGREVMVKLGDTVIARTRRAMRMLETASPPTFYLPPEDVDLDCLQPVDGTTFCEWKGEAKYWSAHCGGRHVERAAWCYPEADAPYEAVRGWFCFYPAKVDCFVDGEPVKAQAGGFYGGWITGEVIGPFKGEPGTGSW